jgi:hypothetical protein
MDKEDPMADFSAFRQPGRDADRAVQLALREIDPGSLARAMLTLPGPDRDIIVRNMSARAAGMLSHDIAELERLPPGTCDARSAALQESFLAKMNRYRSLLLENERLTPEEPPHLGWDSEAELIEGLVRLKRYADRHGREAVAPLLGHGLHPLLEKGLRLYVDDWDPAVVQSVLEQTSESLAAWHANMMRIMIEGVAALFGGDLPQVVAEKLGAFRLADPGHEPRRGG